MEAVGDDHRFGKLFFDDRTIDYSQIHADDPDLLFAFKPKKLRLQGGFRAAERDVVNTVVLQIAEGRGVALLAREEVLVDAQNLGTSGRMILPDPALEVAEKVALHGGGANALASAQATPVDAIQLLLIDHLLEAFAGSLTRLHARQLLAKAAAAIQTAALAHPQIHEAPPEAPVVVPHHPAAPAFVSETQASAPRARYRPGIPGRYRNRAAVSLDVANLVLGQA